MSINVKALIWWTAPLLSVAGLAADSTSLRLVEAVKKQDQAAVRSLLQQGVDVNAPAADGATALAWAAHWNDVETADLLIRAGANVNAMNDYGVTPLWEACNNGNAPMVEKLARAGATLNATLLFTGETALMRCARTGNADAVKALVVRGADVNAKERQKGQTALMWAIEERHPEVAQVLIEHGADVHARSKGGLLVVTVSQGISAQQNGGGFTPLIFAARQGDIDSARLLLEKGADVNEAGPGDQTVLMVAIDCGHEALAIFLVEQGANVNAADRNGLTALHYGLRKEISILRAVVHDPHGFPGLGDYLLRPNVEELVKTLLDHGADPNARIKVDLARVRQLDQPQLGLAGATPFLLAAASGDVSMMRILLAKGADPKLATNDNTTPLMVAAGVGRREARALNEEKQALDAVKLTIELGADVNAASKIGLTALHGAAFTGSNEIIQFLADRGAKLDPMDRHGQTPLSVAEGDPNGLYADDFGFGHPDTPPILHESTAKLLRTLSGNTVSQGTPSGSAPAN